MSSKSLELTRDQILAYRRRVGGLDERQPIGAAALRSAGWAGYRDSMPRAALFSIHARLEGTTPTTLDHGSMVQIWGPGFAVYVVAERDVAPFTLGRLSDAGSRRAAALDLAERLSELLGDSEMTYAEAGRLLGENPNRLRYATLTGSLRLRWDGARRPTIRIAAPPDVDPVEARAELARRYLHVFGTGTAESFSGWAGVSRTMGTHVFESLRKSLLAVRSPLGEAWILADAEDEMKSETEPSKAVRLLPSGDTYYLLWGTDRDLLVPQERFRSELWTSRVWPGALLVDGEIVGTWRRTHGVIDIDAWAQVARHQRQAIETEAATLPIPGLADGEEIEVRWG